MRIVRKINRESKKVKNVIFLTFFIYKINIDKFLPM